MTLAQLLRLRLRNQQLVDSSCRTPLDVVARLGAVQSQDYPAARWAIGLRAPGVNASAVDAAFDSGAIVRTHVLRPTWHFVAPADVRWMLALTGPRIRAAMGSYFRRIGLDAKVLDKSRKTIARALSGNPPLTRAEVAMVLARARLPAKGLGAVFLLIDAEIEGLICSGPRKGTQHTYTWLDDRVKPTPALSREDAIRRLTATYFQSHGPATVRDFAWWSGLTVRDARAGIEMHPSFESCRVHDTSYWSVPAPVPKAVRGASIHLLPNFDEYLVAYQDRHPITSGVPSRVQLSRGDLLSYRVISGGTVIGTWKRAAEGAAVHVHMEVEPQARAAERAMKTAADEYGAFHGMAARCTIAQA